MSSQELQVGRSISLGAHNLSREVDVVPVKSKASTYQCEEAPNPELGAVKNTFSLHTRTETYHARSQVIVATAIDRDPYPGAFVWRTRPRTQNVSEMVINAEGLARVEKAQPVSTLAKEFFGPARAQSVAISIGVGDVIGFESPFLARVCDRLQPDSLMLHARASLELPIPHSTITDHA